MLLWSWLIDYGLEVEEVLLLNQLGEVMLIQFFWRNKFLSALYFFIDLLLLFFRGAMSVYKLELLYFIYVVMSSQNTVCQVEVCKTFSKFLKLLNKASMTIFLLWWTTLYRTYSHREVNMPIWIVEEFETRRFKFIFLTWYFISLKKVWSILIGYMWFCSPANFSLEPFKNIYFSFFN